MNRSLTKEGPLWIVRPPSALRGLVKGCLPSTSTTDKEEVGLTYIIMQITVVHIFFVFIHLYTVLSMHYLRCSEVSVVQLGT